MIQPMDYDQVEAGIELRGVYDGISVYRMKDGTLVNRWADREAPDHPMPGYERRYFATQEYIESIREASQ